MCQSRSAGGVIFRVRRVLEQVELSKELERLRDEQRGQFQPVSGIYHAFLLDAGCLGHGKTCCGVQDYRADYR